MFTEFVWNVCVCWLWCKNVHPTAVLRIGMSRKFEDVKLTGKLLQYDRVGPKVCESWVYESVQLLYETWAFIVKNSHFLFIGMSQCCRQLGL
jgi:hypothetical protein